jgi:superfamily II DNA or RNA helicase
MPIQPKQIVKNLISTEAVIINHIQPLGQKVSIEFTGVNSKRQSSKVISMSEFEQLEVLTEKGMFNFSGNPTQFTLFAEAERIHSAYQFDPLFAVNCSIVDPLPHQVEAVYKFLLPLPQIRFLLADDTGAGKTIMTGLLIKELMMRSLIERVLIVTPGGLTKQWQEDEMQLKFNIPFTLVNRGLFNSDPNVFHTASKIITSIDFISREEILNVASNSHWDLIVFDESHKLSAYDYGNKQYLSQRYKAAQLLSKQCEHLLLLTATPHRGRPDTFKKLLQLLDEDIFASDEIASTRVKEIEHNGINKFFIRRLKEDMTDWDGKPLYKNRATKTIAYQLTPEEKKLYDAVTDYLTVKKEEATQTNNIHVSLALAVMQRRLVSSIFAIKNTLEKRWKTLQSIADELSKNPNLWSQRHKLEGFDVKNIEDFDELEDNEKEALESILSDPKKFKLFTTAKSLPEIQKEAIEVKQLFQMAQSLYNQNQSEKKFLELRELLMANGVIDHKEKLVIFTEHKDTLLYLEQRLSNSEGYNVVTIHGGKSVEERRDAQRAFAKPNTQILIATDAAGEGINLQFCRLLINWDIPWNPNRLEQRMGRIHRYGQKQDVLVFNMVANNTREGKVLERLLTKLDIIRQGIGDDRVYDVIQDVLDGVSLDAIMKSVFNGQETEFNQLLNQDNETLKIKFAEKINQQTQTLAHSTVNFVDAQTLKVNSDEKRLQPIYVKMFFEKTFQYLGGKFTQINNDIFKIDAIPEILRTELQNTHKMFFDTIKATFFCFDKQTFLNYQMSYELQKTHYMAPGNAIFDSLVNVAINLYREDALKGTILISPDDPKPYFAFLVKSQIVDNRPHKQNENIANEILTMICQNENGDFFATSSAKFIDLHAPTDFAKPIQPPATQQNNAVLQWAYEHITEPQLDNTQKHIQQDITERKNYLTSAFTHLIMNMQAQVQELQTKMLFTNANMSEKIQKKEERINELIQRKKNRLKNLDLMVQLSPKAPEVMGCAYIVPLTKVEYQTHYGMSRDDEAEQIAMQTAMQYEISNHRTPTDVSTNNEGYDIISVSTEQLKRYIEVKGRSGSDGSIMMSENEMHRLEQLGDTAWLYIVTHCKTNPQLHRIQNPAKNLIFERKSKGIQYFLPMTEWQNKVNP